MRIPLRAASLLTDLYHKRLPGQLVIQITDRCNASCPQCGMRVSEDFPRTKLPLDDVKRILDGAAEKGIQVVSFTGGEPFLIQDEVVEMIRYAGRVGIECIRTGTNGFFLRGAGTERFRSKVEGIAESLAGTPLRNLWISLDSAVPSVHERMRGLPGVVEGIEKALPIFHSCGIYPAVNLGINRCMGGEPNPESKGPPAESDEWEQAFCEGFKEAFRQYYRFAIDLGFTMVNACYPMSVDTEERLEDLDPVYAATSRDDVVRFGKKEKALIFKALMEVIPEYRSEIRIFSPRISLLALHRQYSQNLHAPTPCRGGLDFFFVDSRDGNTYPCGYRGSENMGRFWDLDRKACTSNTPCTLCDWECFRDPSELSGPLLQGLSNPMGLFSRVLHDREYLRVWAQDLRYYWACDFFDGRRPPNLDRLRAFGRGFPPRDSPHTPRKSNSEQAQR
jgi:MoaA/NifB/PqqE/SkfB family radical SAM enzyme